MVDETPDDGIPTAECMIIEGPGGSLYLISEDVLRSHRLPDEVAEPLRAAYQGQRGDSAADSDEATSSFQILGQGPVVRRGSLTVPTMDTWFDMMRAPEPRRPASS